MGLENEKQELGDGSYLYIKGHPYVGLVRDGPGAGVVAVFVQLCSEKEVGNKIGITDLAAMVAFSEKERCVLVGVGDHDPFQQNFLPFAKLLNVEYAMDTRIETCGEFWIEGAEYFDIICSPRSSRMHESIEEYAGAFKYYLDCDYEYELCIPIINGERLAVIADYDALIYLIPKTHSDEEHYRRNKDLVLKFALEHDNCIAGCDMREFFLGGDK